MEENIYKSLAFSLELVCLVCLEQVWSLTHYFIRWTSVFDDEEMFGVYLIDECVIL